MSLHFSFKIPLLASMAGFKAFSLGHLERDAHFYRLLEQSQKNNDKIKLYRSPEYGSYTHFQVIFLVPTPVEQCCMIN